MGRSLKLKSGDGAKRTQEVATATGVDGGICPVPEEERTL